MDFDASARPSKRRKLFAMLPSRSSLTDLLASFGAHRSPISASRMNIKDEESHLGQHAQSPDLRRQDSRIVLSRSDPSGDDSHNAPPDEQVDITNVDPEIDELADEDVIHVMPRGTSARLAAERNAAKLEESKIKRKSLRASTLSSRDRPTSKASRSQPTRSTRNVVSYVPPRESPRSTPRAERHLLVSDTVPVTKAQTAAKPFVETARNKVRNDIAAYTKPKRDAFLLRNQDVFHPLLSDNSYIDKLDRISAMQDGDEGESDIVPKSFLKDQPRGVTATMKPYQLEGLSFLVNMHRNGMSAILGDEMGLGKTLQTLSLFQWLTENEPATGEVRPHLVVCPLSVLSSWMAESRKWVPGLNVVRFHGPRAERDRLKQDCLEMKQRHESNVRRRSANTDEGRIDLVVTTYETFVSEQNWFKRIFVWKYCVLDEGHKIKNDKSNMSTALQTLSAEYRLLLTGTPLQNNLLEMWALLHWLFPEVFTPDTADRFKKAFDLSHGTVSTSFMDDARRLLELIMLRRMKTSIGVNLDLPPKEEVLLYVPLTPMQRFWYTRLLTRTSAATLDELFKNLRAKEHKVLEHEVEEDQELQKKSEAVDAAVDGSNVWAESKAIMEEAIRSEQTDKSGSWQKLMNLLMQLRKICIHPYMMNDAAPEEYNIGEHIKIASGKFIVLDKLIDELVLKQRKKVLIFSGFTSALNLIEELMYLKGANTRDGAFRFSRLDGQTARAQRNLNIRLFNDQSSDVKVMLLSTRAGGLGINLTSATEVIFMDEDWNPQATLQAEARAHRIGQTKKVTIYKLCSQGTVEEQMMGRIRKKLYLSAKITESMRNIHTADSASKKRKRTSTHEATDDQPHLDTASLQSLIRRGAQTLARPEIDITEMVNWDWSTTLEKCKDQPIDTLIAHSSSEPSAIDEQSWLNTMERVETAIFEGKAHQKQLLSALSSSSPSTLSRADRRIDKKTTVLIDGFAISKQSLLCADWEAVPTLAGKDPRLASPPRRAPKPPLQHQEYCQVCWDGGDLTLCAACPRAYHLACVDPETRKRAAGITFYCSQHQCRDCGGKTAEAGGLIFRCRWCENGFCEDCLDWDRARLVGEAVMELEMLGYPRNQQAYYVECAGCVKGWEENPEDKRFIEEERARIEREYAEFRRQGEEDATEAGALQTPDTVSEVHTPKMGASVTGEGKKMVKKVAKKKTVKKVKVEDDLMADVLVEGERVFGGDERDDWST